MEEELVVLVPDVNGCVFLDESRHCVEVEQLLILFALFVIDDLRKGRLSLKLLFQSETLECRGLCLFLLLLEICFCFLNSLGFFLGYLNFEIFLLRSFIHQHVRTSTSVMVA